MFKTFPVITKTAKHQDRSHAAATEATLQAPNLKGPLHEQYSRMIIHTVNPLTLQLAVLYSSTEATLTYFTLVLSSSQSELCVRAHPPLLTARTKPSTQQLPVPGEDPQLSSTWQSQHVASHPTADPALPAAKPG